MDLTKSKIESIILSYKMNNGVSKIMKYTNYINLTEFWINYPDEEILPKNVELQDNTLVYVLEQQAGVTFRTWALYNKMKYKNVRFLCADASLVDGCLSLKNVWKELPINGL